MRAAWAVAGATLLALPASAQEPVPQLRPFGAPFYWLNLTANDRLPIRERQLVFMDGITGPQVPAPKRQGLTPRLSFGLESRSKTGGGPSDSDTIATLTPGLAYTKLFPKGSFVADLTWESAQHFDQESFSDALANFSGDAQLSYSLDERNRLSALFGYAELRDTGDALLTGFLPASATISVRNTILTWSHEFDENRVLDLLASNILSATDQPGAPDITTNSFSALYAQNLNNRDLLEAVFYYDNVAFENSSTDNVWSGFARWTRDFSPRLSIRGELGIIATDAGTGRSYPKLGGAVIHTTQNARYELSAARDFISVPGVDGLLRTDLIRAQAHLRLARALQLQGSIERQYLKGISATPIDTQTTSLDLGLSYAVDKNTWLWTRLRGNREKSAGLTQRDTRVYFGLSRSFN